MITEDLKNFLQLVLATHRHVVNSVASFHKEDYILVIGQQEEQLLKTYVRPGDPVVIDMKMTDVSFKVWGYDTIVSHMDSATYLVNKRDIIL